MKDSHKDIRKNKSSLSNNQDNFLNISKKIDFILSDKLNFQDELEIKPPKIDNDFSIPSFSDNKVPITDETKDKIKNENKIPLKNKFNNQIWQHKPKTVASLKRLDKFHNETFGKHNIKERVRSLTGKYNFFSSKKNLGKRQIQGKYAKNKSEKGAFINTNLEKNATLKKFREGKKKNGKQQNKIKNNISNIKRGENEFSPKEKSPDNKKTGILFNKNKTKRLKPLITKQKNSQTKEKQYYLNSKLDKNSQNFKTISSTKNGLLQIIKKTNKVPIFDKEDTVSVDFELLKTKKLREMGFDGPESFEEIDFYPLVEPYSCISVIHAMNSPDRVYVLLEVELSQEEARNLLFIKETLGVFTLDTAECETKGNNIYLLEKINQIIEDYSIEITPASKQKLIYYLEKELLGLGKLEPLMNDPNIEDISCDGSEVPIFLYHRKHGSLKSNLQFGNEDELSAFVVRLSQKCGKHISIANPMLDATMPDGSRIQMTLSDEVTTKGSTFTIRKFRESPFSPADLIEFNTMSSELVAYIWIAVENNINALFAGGTASGKTSALNAIALFIPSDSKIVSIEETREINLPHPNWIPGVARSGFGEVIGDKVVGEIDLYDLMKAALRQRPEYIIVGEIRGKEAYVLFQAMATGHTTYSTVHADSAKSLIHRLEGRPINIPRIMLQSLDIICIQTTARVRDKRARRCRQVIEIIDIDPATKEILTNEVFRWDPVEDKFFYSGKSYVLERIRTIKDMSREEIIKELRNRAELLDWMKEKNIKDFKEVASLTAKYVENPLEIMEKIRGEKSNG